MKRVCCWRHLVTQQRSALLTKRAWEWYSTARGFDSPYAAKPFTATYSWRWLPVGAP